MPQPIIFQFSDLRSRRPMLGVSPSWQGFIPLPAKFFVIGGVTRDSTGAALGSCTVDLYLSSSKTRVDTVTSDGSGNYQFTSAGPAEFYYAVAYKAGSPDVAGTTVNTLAGV